MIEWAKSILEFIIIFLLMYFCYYFFSYRKIVKYNRKKVPVNIKYLENKYKLDIVKIGYKKVFKTLMICDSLIVAILFVLTKSIDNIYLRLLIAFILVFPLFAGIYHLIAMYYKKESER